MNYDPERTYHITVIITHNDGINHTHRELVVHSADALTDAQKQEAEEEFSKVW
jgi:hypothetical protein